MRAVVWVTTKKEKKETFFALDKNMIFPPHHHPLWDTRHMPQYARPFPCLDTCTVPPTASISSCTIPDRERGNSTTTNTALFLLDPFIPSAHFFFPHSLRVVVAFSVGVQQHFCFRRRQLGRLVKSGCRGAQKLFLRSVHIVVSRRIQREKALHGLDSCLGKDNPVADCEPTDLCAHTFFSRRNWHNSPGYPENHTLLDAHCILSRCLIVVCVCMCVCVNFGRVVG